MKGGHMDKKELYEKKPLIKLNDKIFPCPTSAAMEFIGGKWKSAILTHLIDSKKRYSELRKEIPTITERTLSLQLKQMEQDGLISRKVFNIKPPLKVEYELTDFGKTVIPVLRAIVDWGITAAEEKGEFLVEERD
jgi:DNA-binding HxlR family transcriptional regulator